ncbi:DUF6087 family protein [Streptomyces cinerochromogenes]|uniref:DUF6087 family protein n=1 Tax=Streptomyces cinerochromogenes TaxID=66422 RepID=UPI003679D213
MAASGSLSTGAANDAVTAAGGFADAAPLVKLAAFSRDRSDAPATVPTRPPNCRAGRPPSPASKWAPSSSGVCFGVPTASARQWPPSAPPHRPDPERAPRAALRLQAARRDVRRGLFDDTPVPDRRTSPPAPSRAWTTPIRSHRTSEDVKHPWTSAAGTGHWHGGGHLRPDEPRTLEQWDGFTYAPVGTATDLASAQAWSNGVTGASSPADE